MTNDSEKNPRYSAHPDDETLALGGKIEKLDVNSKIFSKMISGF